MSQRLSTSVTFQNLEDRVAALEGEAALSSSKIVAALGYTPANVAGDNFVYVNAHTFIGSIEGGGGSVNASGSSVPGYTGIVEFRTIGGDRNGFVGLNAENGPMHYGSDTGTGHYFEGGLISPDPAMRFGLRFNSVDGVLDFDSGDCFYYSRVADMFLFNVGGATKASIDGGGVMSVAQLALDQEFYQTVASSTNNPLINFDSADYIAYDRAGNSYTFYINNSSTCSISPIGITAKELSAAIINLDNEFYFNLLSSNPRIALDNGGDEIVYDRAADVLTTFIGGAAQLKIDPSGTFVTNVLNVGDVNFGLSLNGGGQPLLAFKSGAYFSYNRGTDAFAWVIGNASRMSLDSSGALSTAGPLFPGNDAAFSFQITSGNPTIVFDNGDTLRFDRANNKFVLCIGNVDVASLDMAGNIRIKGTLTSGATTV